MSVYDPMEKAKLSLLEDLSLNPIENILNFGEQGMELVVSRLNSTKKVNFWSMEELVEQPMEQVKVHGASQSQGREEDQDPLSLHHMLHCYTMQTRIKYIYLMDMIE